MDSGIQNVILNEKKTDKNTLKQIIPALSNPTILNEKGGYIFKTLVLEDTLYLGLLPYLIDGKRTYHFNIKMPQEEFVLIGFINSNGSIELLFKMKPEQYKAGLSLEEIKYYRKSYIKFARCLLEFKFNEEVKLDAVTRQALTEIKIFTEVPRNIKGLALKSF